MSFDEWDFDHDGKLSMEERTHMDYFLNEYDHEDDDCDDEGIGGGSGSGPAGGIGTGRGAGAPGRYRKSGNADPKAAKTLVVVGLMILGGAFLPVVPVVGVIFFGLMVVAIFS